MSSRDTSHGEPLPRRPAGEHPKQAAGGWPQLTAIAVVGTLATIAVALDWDSPIRMGAVLLFLLFGPGLAIAVLLQIRDPFQQLALAPATSLALDTIVAVTLLYIQIYSYELAFAIVAAITAVALVLGVLRGPRASLAGSRSRRANA